jgi:hypothetical protein
MKFLLPIFLIAFSFSASAERLQSKVDSIEISPKKGVPHLVKLENGRVVFVDYNDRETIDSFRQSMKSKDMLEVDLDEKYSFVSAETIDDSEETPVRREVEERMSYEPTMVSGTTEASKIFRRMRRDYQNKSQCYNRAHIWAHEEYKKTGLKSMKLFLFFTSRYIRNYRYKWWFHVAPMVNTPSGDLVLDRRYSRVPQYKDTWTKDYIYSGRKCPIVSKYYDYRNNQGKEDCYLIPVSMYFWQPRDIEKRDRTGYEKTQYFQSEINHAYWEAF